MTSNVSAGNRLVVEVGAWNGGGANTSSVTDSGGDTFTELTSFSASDGTQMSIWTAPITNSGGTMPTITAKPGATSDMAIAVLEYQGLSTAAGTTVLDQLATAPGTTSGAATVSSGATARRAAPTSWPSASTPTPGSATPSAAGPATTSGPTTHRPVT